LDALVSEYSGIPVEPATVAGEVDVEIVNEIAAAVAVAAVIEEEE
jgi:hypothetical protein